MPQGPTGLEPDAWQKEWILTAGTSGDNSDISSLHGRGRSAVQAHYQASLPLSDPWSAARDALFGTLMGGFENLTEFLGDIAEAIAGAGKRALEDITVTISNIANAISLIFSRLWDAAGNFIANVTGAIVDGVKSMADFLSGLWDALTGNIGSSGKTVDDITVELSGVASDASTASSASATNGENLQTTWNELYDGLNGSTGSTNRTPVEVRQRGAAVRQKAIDADGKADAAQLEAEGAAGAAGTAQTAAETAQGAAEDAQESADDANALIDSRTIAGDNLVTNPGFENWRLSPQGGQWWTQAARIRSGSRSLRMAGDGQYRSHDLFVNGSQLLYLEATPGDRFVVDVWVWGEGTNPITTGNLLWLQTTEKYFDGRAQTNSVLGYITGDACRGGWTQFQFWYTVPSDCVGFRLYLVTNCPSPNVFYVDDVVVKNFTFTQRVVDGVNQAVTGGTGTGAALSSVRDNVALVSGAAADAATAAQGAQSTATTADGNVRQTWDSLYDTFSGTTGSSGRGLSEVSSAGSVVRQTAIDAADAADKADIKAVAAQSALNEVAKSGSNIAANPGCESTVFMLSSNATEYSTELKRSGARSIKMTGITGQNIDVQFFKSVVAPIITLPVTGGDVLYFEAWIRGGSGNTKVGGAIRPYLLSGDPASPTMSYPASIATYTGTLTDLNAGWQKLSGFFLVPAGAVGLQCVVQLHTGSGTGCVLHVDDLVCYRITEAYNAQIEAEAAAGAAGTAQTAAETAQGAAEEADDKAVVAQDLGYQLGNRGANLLPNGSFENSNFYIGAGPNRSYSSDDKRSGTQSLRCKGYMWTPLFADQNTFYLKSPCAAGDKIYYEIYVKGAVGNVASTRTCFIQTQFFDQNGNYISNSIQYPASVNAGTGLNGAWTKLSGIATAPANAASHDFTIVQLGSTVSGTEANNVYFWDDAKCYRVTEALAAQDAADSKVPQTFFDAAQRGGDNLATNPVFSDTSQYLWGSGASYSTDYKRTGTHSAKVSNNGTSDYYVSVINRSDNSGNAYVTVYPGQVFYCEFYVYQTGGSNSSTVSMYVQLFDYDLTYRAGTFAAAPTFTAANNGVWTKVSGFFVVPDPPANVNYAQARFLLRSHGNTASGTVRYFDDVIVRDVTEAYYAQIEAEAAAGAAETAQGAAETADGKAVVAQQRLEEWASAGASLSTNPGFEDTSQHLGNGWAYSTEQAYSGTRSAKYVSDGSTYVGLSATATSSNRLGIKVRPDQVFYLEAYVRGHTDNTATGSSGISLVGVFYRNDLTGPFLVTATTVGPTQVGKDTWVKLSGTVIVPADRQLFFPRFDVSGATIPSGNTYYVDWFNTFDITEAYYAQKDADAAQADADLAQATVDSVAASGNLVISPNFEDTAISRIPYTANAGTIEYVTESPYEGSRCLKYTINTPAWNGIFLAPSMNKWRFDVKPGDTYRASIQFKPGASLRTRTTGTAYLYMRFRNASTNADTVTQKGLGATSTGWQEFAATATCPAGYHILEVMFLINGQGLANDFFFLDAASVENVTSAAAINEKLYGAKTATPAQTIITASIPEFDGSKILSGSVSEDRVQNLTANLTLFNANNSAGANLVPDPSFEDATLDAKRKATSGSVANWWTDVTDIVHSGSRAMEVTYASSGNDYPSLQLTPTLTPNWWQPGYDNVRIACRPGQVFYLSQWVYLRPGNTGTREMNLYLATFNAAGTIQYMVVQAFPALETWTKIEGYFKVTRSDVVSVVPLFGAFRPGNSLNAKAIVDDCEMFDVTDSYNRTQTTWDNLYDAFNGTTGSSNRTIDEVRERGAAVRQKANDADDTANFAKSEIGLKSKDFTNLAAGSDFESGFGPWKGTSRWTIATDQFRSGTQSLKLPPGSGGAALYLGDYPTVYEVKPGDRIYMEFWAYADSNYSATIDGKLRIGSQDNSLLWYLFAMSNNFTQRNVWQKFSTTYTVPSGVRGLIFTLQWNTNQGNLWLDDIVIRRVVASEAIADSAITTAKIADNAVTGSKQTLLDASKIVSGQIQPDIIANLPQSKVDSLTTDLGARLTKNSFQVSLEGGGENWALNPSFEDESIPLWSGSQYSTEYAHTGVRSLKITANGSELYGSLLQAPSSSVAYPYVYQGQILYVEFWMYQRFATNTSGVTRVLIQYYNNSTFRFSHYGLTVNTSTSHNDNWTKHSAFVQMPYRVDPADYNRMRMLINVSGNTQSGVVRYFDDVTVRDVTNVVELNQALYNQDTPLSNILESKLPSNIDGSKIQTGSVASDRIQNLPASKITSGSFTEDRIPTLAQSKVTSLTTDLDKNKQLSLASILASSNLCTNPGFEQPDFVVGHLCGYDTNLKRNGARSIKATHNGSNYVLINMNPAPNGVSASGRLEIPVVGGSVLYLEAWLRGGSDNVNTNLNYWFQYYWRREDGSTNTAGTTAHTNAGDARIDTWTKMSGYITAPSDAVALSTLWVVGHNQIPNDNIYYVDDPIIHLVSNSALISDSAVTTAKIADNAVTGSKQTLLDASKIVSGQIQPDIVANLPQNKVTGLPAGEEVGYEALAQTIARLADELASLKADSEAAELSGQNIKVNFSDYGNVTNLATQTALPAKKWQITNVNGTTYTGATWGTLNGNAQFTGNVSSGSGTAKIIYLGDPAVTGSEKTFTDYQRIRGVLSTPPDGYVSTPPGGGPAFTAIGRVSDDGNSYVWAKAQFVSQLNLRGSIGCRVNGTEYIWADNIPLGFSLEMTFILGADNNPMKFQVFSGTTLVKEHIDNAKDKNNATIPYSLRGNTTTNYRRWGAITAYSNGLTSGKISSVTATDNLPVDYKGSVARMHRTATTDTGTVSTVDNPLPTNFFAAPLFASQDITASSANGTFKVSNSKMYAVNARIQLASHTAANCRIDLQVSTDNGASWTTVQRGATTWAFDSFHNQQAQDYAVTGNWLQYLNAGDMVRLVTRANTGSKTDFLTGGPDGTTYFTISGL